MISGDKGCQDAHHENREGRKKDNDAQVGLFVAAVEKNRRQQHADGQRA
jgi:hypothetical protein